MPTRLSSLSLSTIALHPTIARDLCMGHGQCAAVCPQGVLAMRRMVGGGGDAQQAFVVRHSACDGCGACVSACPNGAISLEGATAALWQPARPGVAHGRRAAHG